MSFRFFSIFIFGSNRSYSTDPFNPWVRVFEVICGVGGNWIAPDETEWPLCQYKDEYSCDPVEEIEKSAGYLASGLKPQSTSFVYKGDQATFVCNQTGFVTDEGESIKVDCDDNGDFVQNINWPVCRPPTCQVDDRPFANETGELSTEGEDDIAVNSFLEYKCPGGNITDEGRSILLQCVGNKQFETRDAWPECRQSLICLGNESLPEMSSVTVNCPQKVRHYNPLQSSEREDFVKLCFNVYILRNQSPLVWSVLGTTLRSSSR